MSLKAIEHAKAEVVKSQGSLENFLAGASEAAFERNLAADFEAYKTVGFQRKPELSIVLDGGNNTTVRVRYSR